MDNLKEFVDYAPVIIIVMAFLFKNRLIVTPEQLEKKHKEIIDEAERKFVSLIAYQEFRHSTERKFDELINGVNEIKNFLLNNTK